MRLFILFLLCAATAHSKIIHIRIPVPGSQEGSYWRDQYTIDENLPVWRLRNVIFHDYRLDSKEYVLAQETSAGYTMLDVEAKLLEFGSEPGAAVLLFAVPRRMVKQAEEVQD